MKEISEFFQGKKTYVVGLAGLLVIAASLAGVIPAETANVLLSVLGFSGLVTLRAGIK